MKKKKLLLLLPLLVIVGLKIAPLYLRYKLTEQFISKESYVNSSLPIAVEDGCVLSQIKMGPDLRIEYIYQFEKLDNDTMSREYLTRFDSLTYAGNYERVRSTSEFRLFRKYGGVVVVTSNDSNNEQFSQVTVEFEMMRSHSSWQAKELLLN